MPFINLLFDLAFGIIQVVVFVMLSVVNTSQKIDDSEMIMGYHYINTKDETYGDRRNYGNGYKIKTKQHSLDQDLGTF